MAQTIRELLQSSWNVRITQRQLLTDGRIFRNCNQQGIFVFWVRQTFNTSQENKENPSIVLGSMGQLTRYSGEALRFFFFRWGRIFFRQVVVNQSSLIIDHDVVT